MIRTWLRDLLRASRLSGTLRLIGKALANERDHLARSGGRVARPAGMLAAWL